MLHVVVRTPHEVVGEFAVLSLRVPTDTGQVGIRPRAEAAVTAIEPGLVFARTPEGRRFISTAGGLLRAGASEAVLLTPLAVLGHDAAAVVAAVDRCWPAPTRSASSVRQSSASRRGSCARSTEAAVASGGDGERPDMRRSIARDARRHARRKPTATSFWHSLSLLGTVGWAIALPAAGGALLGHELDLRLGTSVRFTLMLLAAGVVLGAALAWHALERGRG